MRGLRAISDMQAKRPTLGQLQRLGADPVSAVFLFSCRDRHSELVFLGWQGTGGEGGERAGRILRLVEIEDYFAVGRRGRVQKARCRIGLVTAGQVGNDEEEKPVGILLNREQLIRVTVTLKRRLRHLSPATQGKPAHYGDHGRRKEIPRTRGQPLTFVVDLRLVAWLACQKWRADLASSSLVRSTMC